MPPIDEQTCCSNVILEEKFDFDKWKELHEKDPEKFEIQRKIYLEHTLATTNKRNKRRLEGIIFQVNAMRQRTGNPLKSCLDISKMMWGSFYQLHDLLNHSKLFLNNGSYKLQPANSEIDDSVSTPKTSANSKHQLIKPKTGKTNIIKFARKARP